MTAKISPPTLFPGVSTLTLLDRWNDRIILQIKPQSRSPKVLKIHLLGRERLDRFQEEVQILQDLQGVPHVPILRGTLKLGPQFCESLALDREEDVRAIVMDAVPCQNAYELFINHEAKTVQRLSYPQIKSIARQALEMLANLEARNIVHGDIDPRNFIYEEDSDHLTICGFGLAANVRESQALLYQKFWRYDAPEVLLGTPHGVSADLWSLGVVIFELFTQIPLFEPMIDVEDRTRYVSEWLHLLRQNIGQGPDPMFPPSEKTQEIIDQDNETSKRFPALEIWKVRICAAAEERGEETEDEVCELVTLLDKMLQFRAEDRSTPEALLNEFFPSTTSREMETEEKRSLV